MRISCSVKLGQDNANRTYRYSNGNESLAKFFTMDTDFWLGDGRGRWCSMRLGGGSGRWCSMTLGDGSGGRYGMRLGRRGGGHSVVVRMRDVGSLNPSVFLASCDECRMTMS